MNITRIIEMLPESVKVDIIDFNDVKLNNGKNATRILLDRVLTEEEKNVLNKNKKIVGTDCVACHRYAPEIKKSYFYIM